MKTIDEGHSMNQDETSLLEEAVMERNVMYSHFDSMIEDEGEFNITLVTMPDDYIINFHNYLHKILYNCTMKRTKMQTQKDILLFSQSDNRFIFPV